MFARPKRSGKCSFGWREINDLPGQPDVATYNDLEILKKGEKVLEGVRNSPLTPDGSGDYIDPDN